MTAPDTRPKIIVARLIAGLAVAFTLVGAIALGQWLLA